MKSAYEQMLENNATARKAFASALKAKWDSKRCHREQLIQVHKSHKSGEISLFEYRQIARGIIGSMNKSRADRININIARIAGSH